tara:strand:+ start:358 stop:780 length:423 start_codon:yes stop_codon:yes gene_type:complete
MSIYDEHLFKQQLAAYSTMWGARIRRARLRGGDVGALLWKAKSAAVKAAIKHWDAANGPVNPAGELIGMHHRRPEGEVSRHLVWSAIAKFCERKITEHRVQSSPLRASAPEWTPSAQWSADTPAVYRAHFKVMLSATECN